MQDSMEELREQVTLYVLAQLEAGYTPLEVAAVFNVLSLQLYRTVLSEEDYHLMLESLRQHGPLVQSLDPDHLRRWH